MTTAEDTTLPFKLPSGWQATLVGAEFFLILGKMLDAEKNVGVPKPYLGNKSVQWGRIDTGDLSQIKLTPGDLRRYRLMEGDLLVCEGGDIGRSAIWRGQLDECYFQKALHRVRPRGGFSPVLLRYLLEYYSKTGFLLNFATQTSIAHLPKDKFEVLPLPKPPLKEQEAIAEALSDADALIEGLERLIAKKRLIKQGAMQDLLTAKRRLPGFSGEWDVKQLGEIFEIGSSKRVFQSDWRSFGIPFYRAREIVLFAENSEVDKGLFIAPELYETLRKVSGVPEKGDLLVTGVGTLGRVFLVANDEPFYFKDGNIIWFKIRGSMSSEYLRQVFQTDEMMQQIYDSAGGSTVGTYTISNAKKTRIRFPKVDEQEAIALVLGDTDAEIQALETRLEKARQVKEGMMQNLLTGRIRLV